MHRHSLYSGLSILAALVLTACAAGKPEPMNAANLQATSAEVQTGAPERSMAIDLRAAIAEIDALEAPADVDNAVFAELKAELARLLALEPDNTAIDSNERAGSALDPETYDLELRYFTNYTSMPFGLYEGNTLREYLMHDGDFDQNGVVNSADLIPLARHLGERAGDSLSITRVIDADNNSLITAADMVAIARNFGSTVGSVAYYESSDVGKYPWRADEADKVEPLHTIANVVLRRDAPDSRAYFEISGIVPTKGHYYWTRTLASGGWQQAGWIGISAALPMPGPLELQYDGESTLSWYHDDFGDADHNGRVEIADITLMLAPTQRAQQLASGGKSVPAFVDRNRDGHYGTADAILSYLMLGHGLHQSDFHYTVCMTTDPQLVPVLSDPVPEGVECISFAYPAGLEWLDSDFDRVSVQIGEVASGTYIWVEGKFRRSEVIQIP